MTTAVAGLVLAGVVLLAGCAKDPGTVKAAEAPAGETAQSRFTGDPESPYCRAELRFFVADTFKQAIDDNDPVALKADFLGALTSLDEARSLAPADIADAWAVKAGIEHGSFAPMFEKYGYDEAKIRSTGSAQEKALLDGDPGAGEEADARIYSYDGQVCGMYPPPAADVAFTGDASSPFCMNEVKDQEEAGAFFAAGADPEALRALYAGPSVAAYHETSGRTAPPEIRDDVIARNKFQADRAGPVLEKYGYDVRRVLLEGSAEERRVFNSDAPEIRDPVARVEAYQAQVCKGPFA